MKLRYKLGGGVLALVGVALLALGLVLSHSAECESSPDYPQDMRLMQAIVYRCYGSPDVLNLEEIPRPDVADNEVLIRVHAASVNPLDWHYMRGSPYLMRLMSGIGTPEDTRMGVDFAGTVKTVGTDVTRFRPGDEVFGGRTGAFAEYVVVREDRALVLKPPGVTFEQAASVPIAAITALQALRDHGKLKSGQNVLINGASGGVGTFAVQIAKALGAEVAGVCSTRNVEMVRSIGADQVFDYTKENYTESGNQYDLIVDMVGNHSLLANRRVLKPEGIFVIVGGPKGNWIAPLIQPVKALLLSPFVGQEFGMMLAELTKEDLSFMAELMQAGKVMPVIDRRYALSEASAAIEYSEAGHARGKIIINVQ